jgi:serine/threonine protein kinase
MPDSNQPPDDGATRRVPPPDSMVVDGYVGLVEIGRGGFGVVYQGSQVEFNRTVALKVLTGVFDDSARARFERECQALGSLSGHPNIVTVYAAGFTRDGRPFLAMEYRPGGSLGQRLGGHDLSWSEAASVGIRIAGALQRAHDLGVLHRDVKPDNILMSAYGEPKLADFGIARFHGGYETRTGVITATFAHAAPELLEGKRPSPASDVYALGSTIYELITGRAPFVTDDEDTLPILLARIASQPPPDLRPLGLPDGVCAVLERALDKNPETRVASAAEFGRQLQAAVRDAGETPTDLIMLPPAPDADTEPLRPGPPPTNRAGAAAPPPAAPPGAPTPPPGAPPPSPVVPSGGPDRRWLVGGIAAAVLAVIGVGTFLLVGGGGDGHPSPSTTTTTTAAGTQIPSSLAGFQKDGSPVNAQLRVFSGQPNYIEAFPWAMNGCGDGEITTAWRSLTPGDTVSAGSTDVHSSTTLTAAQVTGITTGEKGLVTGDDCQEPVFFFASSTGSDNLTDVAITYQRWTATG